MKVNESKKHNLIEMERLKSKIRKGWHSPIENIIINDVLEIPEIYLKNPFAFLPKPMPPLPPDELEWINYKERINAEGWQKGEIEKWIALRRKRGEHPTTLERRKEGFQNQLLKYQNLGISLPKIFIELMQNDEYIKRLSNHHHFEAMSKIQNFPNEQDIYLIPFYEDEQGCCYWNLVIDKKGNHFILFHYLELSVDYEFLEEFDYSKMRICADSIEEFIIRLSLDFRFSKGEETDLEKIYQTKSV